MIVRRLSALGLAAVLVLGLVPGTPSAQDSLEAAKRRELDAMRRAAQEKRAQAGALKGQETRAVGELKRTERQLSATRRRLRALRARRERLDQQLDVNRANLQRSVESLQRQRSKLARRMRHMYMMGPARELEYLVSPSSFGELLMRWDFLQMVAASDRLLLENVRSEKNQVEAHQQVLEENLQEVSRTAKKTTAETTKLTGLRQRHAATVRQIQSKREDYEAAAAELERNARALQNLLARLERQRKAEADKARGQGRGNSGLYLNDQYEFQILDSFGLSGENNECGGYYSFAKPKLNMCLPPLTWQTYDVEFAMARFDDKGAKIKPAVATIRLNGVPVHESYEIPKFNGGGGLADESKPGGIYLQDHGNPVHFRNIWIVEQ